MSQTGLHHAARASRDKMDTAAPSDVGPDRADAAEVPLLEEPLPPPPDEDDLVWLHETKPLRPEAPVCVMAPT